MFSLLFCLMIEGSGSGSGSVSLTNVSRSGRPKKNLDPTDPDSDPQHYNKLNKPKFLPAGTGYRYRTYILGGVEIREKKTIHLNYA